MSFGTKTKQNTPEVQCVVSALYSCLKVASTQDFIAFSVVINSSLYLFDLNSNFPTLLDMKAASGCSLMRKVSLQHIAPHVQFGRLLHMMPFLTNPRRDLCLFLESYCGALTC